MNNCWGGENAENNLQMFKIYDLRRADLERARRFFFAVVRTIITYGCAAWYVHESPEALLPAYRLFLETSQNIFLHLITKSYILTAAIFLQREVHTNSIDAELLKISTTARAKLLGSEVWETIETARNCVIECGRNSRLRPKGNIIRPKFHNPSTQQQHEAIQLRLRALEEYTRRLQKANRGRTLNEQYCETLKGQNKAIS